MVAASLRRVANATRTVSKSAWRSADRLDENPHVENGLIFLGLMTFTAVGAAITYWKVRHREH